MKKQRQAHQKEIEQALEQVAQKYGVLFASYIRPIINVNIEKGRLDYYLDNDETKTSADYVWWVVTHYLQESDRVNQIQQVRSEAVWVLLQGQLVSWAYHFLMRKGFTHGVNTQMLAQEYASEAAIALLQAHFPYDTELDAWMQQIVIYTCCNQTEIWKRQQTNEKKMEDIIKDEKSINTHFNGLEHHVCSHEDNHVIWDAINDLPNPKMQKVIWLRYFADLSSQDIAEIIGSSYRYVDKLHYQAKLLLGKKLNAKGYIYDRRFGTK